jgi:ribonuclease-3
VDVVPSRAVEPDRGRLLTSDLDVWLEATFGAAVPDRALIERALTHGSRGTANYERLEFLGDRVLGLAIAEWLYERFPEEPEGNLSKRINALVARTVCAAVARELGVVPHIRLGKQALSDGASMSDNVTGDVLEALIGALYLSVGHDAARDFIRGAWASRIEHDRAPQHPKAALQEWAAAHNRRPPEYVVVDRTGPDHAQRFTIKVAVGKLGEATGVGSSKQEAETAAALALLETLAK